MSISFILDKLHSQAKENRCLRYFAVFIRICLSRRVFNRGNDQNYG